MHILFLTYHFPTADEPGTARSLGVAQLLKDMGCKVTVVTSGTQYITGEDIRQNRGWLWSKELIENIDVIKTFSISQHRTSLLRKICHYFTYAFSSFLAGLCVTRVDILIICTDPMPIVPLGFMLHIFHSVPFILEERDLYPDTAVALGYLESRFFIGALERWQKFFRKRAKSIIAASPGIEMLLINKGIRKNKISVLPNAFWQEDLPKRVNPSADRILQGYGWGKSFIILYVGKFGYANEFETILKAAKIIQEKTSDIRFFFAGEGEKKRKCIEFCTDNGIQNCHFMPAQPRKFIPFLIKESDIGIQSFANVPFWKCALSTKVFDYMANSTPIVFAGWGDTADLIEKAKAGIATEPGDSASLAKAILFLYENPDLKKKMGENGRLYVLRHFSRNQMGKKLAKALRRQT